MTNPAITYLQKVWQNPAITIKANDQSYKLGSGEPVATIIFHNSDTLHRLARQPSLTFGEGYMSGDIEIEGNLLDVLEGYNRTASILRRKPMQRKLQALRNLRPGRINQASAAQNAQHHYDVGNDFYKLWLDPTLAYTCAYFADPSDSLEAAQRQKFELVCRKARLQPDQSIIDLGCGWGGFMFHAVEKYNVHATGVVVAKEQGTYIQAEAKRRGLEDKISVTIGDWREAAGTYDRVFSIGIMEHVGLRQYSAFMAKYRQLLKPGGVAFLHTIGAEQRINSADPWITKYIFPGGHLPVLEQITHHATKQNFFIADVEDIWQHYALTLNHWSKNFQAHRPQIIDMFDEEFARMWWLYLQGSEAGFRWGGLHLWQVVLLPDKSSSWPLNREVLT